MRVEDWYKPAVIYWIHFKESIDPFSEGYIGISVNLKKRIIDHKSKNKRLRIKLLKGAIVDILEEFSTLLEAAKKEAVYRPTSRIGWNIQPGGQIPPAQTNHSYKKHKLS